MIKRSSLVVIRCGVVWWITTAPNMLDGWKQVKPCMLCYTKRLSKTRASAGRAGRSSSDTMSVSVLCTSQQCRWSWIPARVRGLPVLLQYRAELGGEWLGRMSFTAPAAAAKQGGMWQGVLLLGRCSLPQNGCSLVNPVLNMPVNSRSQPGFCGLWHRCCRQQVQAILAAAGSPLACPSMQLALPLGRDGNHSTAHGLSELLCPSSLGDSLTPSMGESLAHHPQWGGQNSLCRSCATLTPFRLPGQAGC